MCKAFSCLFMENGEVVWKFAVDSHEDLIKSLGARDDGCEQSFVRIEIPPKNGDYLNPDKWIFKVDQTDTPKWFKAGYAEKMCRKAHKEWLAKLDKILIHKPIINPFNIDPPKKITKKHISLVEEWASVRASVGDSVGDSVWDSIWDRVRDSVGAYTGSFFNLKRSDWKYTDKIKGKGYPFQSCVDLWNMGLVPSFDGEKWRLHGHKDARILWEGEL